LKTFVLKALFFGIAFFCCMTCFCGAFVGYATAHDTGAQSSTVLGAVLQVGGIALQFSAYFAVLFSAQGVWGTTAVRSFWCGLLGAVAVIVAVAVTRWMLLGIGFSTLAATTSLGAVLVGPVLTLQLYRSRLASSRSDTRGTRQGPAR